MIVVAVVDLLEGIAGMALLECGRLARPGMQRRD
jgi:hypothetical protein